MTIEDEIGKLKAKCDDKKFVCPYCKKKCVSLTENYLPFSKVEGFLNKILADRQQLEDEIKEKKELLDGANARWAKAYNKWIELEKKLAEANKEIEEILGQRMR